MRAALRATFKGTAAPRYEYLQQRKDKKIFPKIAQEVS